MSYKALELESSQNHSFCLTCYMYFHLVTAKEPKMGILYIMYTKRFVEL